MNQPWKLSPSDLTFLWDECPRCFYLKVARNFRRPSAPFPSIFNRIDKLMKDYYQTRSTTEISPNLPPGIIQFGEKWVQSQPITLSGHTTQFYIRGKFDTAIAFSDGSFGIIDFKTSEPKPEHVPFYSRQLHAYTIALENPAPRRFALSPISKLGLVLVEPVSMDLTQDGKIAYVGDLTWMEVPRDDKSFFKFLDQVLTLLELPSPPFSSPNCSYCNYLIQGPDFL